MELSMDAATISFLCLLVAFIAYFFLINNRTRSKPALLPPAPPSLPILGHMHLLGKLPHQALSGLARKYGPLIILRLGAINMIVVSSPEMAREFLKIHDAKFAFRPQTIASQYTSHNGQDLAMAPYGPLWQNLRRICASELFSVKRLESFRKIREEESLRMVNSIFEHCQAGKDVNVRKELWSFMCDNICRMVTGKRYSGTLETEKLREGIETAIKLTAEFHIGDYFPSLRWMDFRGLERRLQETVNSLDAAMGEILEEHRKQRSLNPGSPPKDLVDVLLAVSEEESGTDFNLRNENIKGVVGDLFAAGTETSAVTTEWALAELLRCPKVMQKAQEELDTVVGRQAPLQESHLRDLPYLQAIVKETLRLHPPAVLLLPHENREVCEVAGYTIPARTRLMVNVWAMGRDAKIWEEPLEFKPERFEGRKMDVKGKDFELLPFGTGRRMCPGLSLGLLKVEIALASLLHSFDWSLRDGEALDMAESFGMSVPRARPLFALAKPRLPPHLYAANSNLPA